VDNNAERPLLRELREDRGWTQQDVARQLVRLAWLRRQERVGVNADMVAKWERGAKGVSPRYRELLCLLFGIDAAELGLGARSADKNRCRAHRETDALVDTLGETATLLDQLGAAGAVLQPKMFEVWRDEIIRRRTLLKLMTLAPAAGLATTGATQPRPGKPTIETVRTLDELVDRYQRLYHSTPPVVLLTPVVAHLETIRDGSRVTTAPALRRKLLANRARVATLAGRLSFFDLSDPMGALTTTSPSNPPAKPATTTRPPRHSDTSPSFPPPTAASPPPWTTCRAPSGT
jgi:transcriptional regulator with XRE-family HTH domain